MSTDNTGRKGVNGVEAIFLGMNWIFREQPVSDFGVDAHVEIVENGEPTGQLIALQIKSGPSWFRQRGDVIVYRGKPRHLRYWENHALPVLLVLHNSETALTVWVKIERHLVSVLPDGHWVVEIPVKQELTTKSASIIAENIDKSDAESVRRRRLALDTPFIREVKAQGIAYVALEEWVNKGLNFRGAAIYYDDPECSEPIHSIEFYYPSRSISKVMDILFPWLSFVYHCRPEEDGSGEVQTHTFEVKLNELGEAFVLMENYYQHGPDPSPEPELPEYENEDDEWGEDDWNAFYYQEAMGKD